MKNTSKITARSLNFVKCVLVILFMTLRRCFEFPHLQKCLQAKGIETQQAPSDAIEQERAEKAAKEESSETADTSAAETGFSLASLGRQRQRFVCRFIGATMPTHKALLHRHLHRAQTASSGEAAHRSSKLARPRPTAESIQTASCSAYSLISLPSTTTLPEESETTWKLETLSRMMSPEVS